MAERDPQEMLARSQVSRRRFQVGAGLTGRLGLPRRVLGRQLSRD